jgi:alpha,alpha-trehalase
MSSTISKTETEVILTPQRLKSALEYIDYYWRKLERYNPRDQGTLVGLPRPYFVPSATNPSGFAYEEMYYWDTFFVAQGLIGTSRQHLVRGLAENLLTLMKRFSMVPNGSRFYFLGHSQPPFLSTLLLQVYKLHNDKRWLARAMDVVKEEYRSVWMGTAHPQWRQVFHGLSRYYDINMIDDLAEAESGWDMTTRFGRKALSYIPVDLNALLYKYEKDFEAAAVILGEKDEAREWSKRALARRAMVQKYLWDDKEGCYFDYNYMDNTHSKVYSLAAFYPMWAGMIDDETAERLVKKLRLFECEGGLTTTAGPLPAEDIPVQWAYPNGWAPLQLIVIQGLERYGYHETAERLARKWLTANLVQFERTGEFLEKYNVVDIEAEPVGGLYPSQKGFGWTNAVFVRLCHDYLEPSLLPKLASVPTFAAWKQWWTRRDKTPLAGTEL